MIKRIIITITALVLMNSLINLVIAEPIYGDAYGAEIGCYVWEKPINIDAGKQSAEMWYKDVYGDSQKGYDSTQNVNGKSKKDIIVSNNGVNDQDSGHYDNTLEERLESWEWF